MRMTSSAAALLVLMGTGLALAGPVADFKAGMTEAYAAYRQALFTTNAGDPGKARVANQAFRDKWDALRAEWEKTPPPHLADDPAFATTLDRVAGIASSATGIIAEGNLPEAHEKLEAIRAEISALNERNGVVTFSDFMNDYHAQMEHVIRRKYTSADGLDAVADAGVLEWLGNRLEHKADAGQMGDPEFRNAIAAVRQSITTFMIAARSQNPEAIHEAQGGLKKPYARLFLRWG